VIRSAVLILLSERFAVLLRFLLTSGKNHVYINDLSAFTTEFLFEVRGGLHQTFSEIKKGSRKGRGERKGIKRNIVRSAIFFCFAIFALFAGDLLIISENVYFIKNFIFKAKESNK